MKPHFAGAASFPPPRFLGAEAAEIPTNLRTGAERGVVLVSDTQIDLQSRDLLISALYKTKAIPDDRLAIDNGILGEQTCARIRSFIQR